MEARWMMLALVAVLTATQTLYAQSRRAVRTANFVVSANTQEMAEEAARTAEDLRQRLAIHWLGKELPDWPKPCPIIVRASPQLGAGGATRFIPEHGTIRGWDMDVQGSRERVLDSVLPHEITHTILATYFAPLGKPVPRWADEGACTTVEHVSERSKHDAYLVKFLTQNRGLPFATMFTLREYPQDIMPLYAQGYSVTSFLIAQGGNDGPRRFVRFLEDGLRTDDWVSAVEKHYQYPKVGKLQSAWNDWVGDGGGETSRFTADARGVSVRAIAARGSIDGSSRYPEGSAVALASLIQPDASSSLSREELTRLPRNPADPPSLMRNVAQQLPAPSSNSDDNWYRKRLAVSQDASNALSPASIEPPSYQVTRPQPMQSVGSSSVDLSRPPVYR